MTGKKQIELLAPAGSYETFLAVLQAGADAVYLGGSRFGARAYANNFKEEELLSAIDYAHMHGRQVYLTVNTLFKEAELGQLYRYLLPYYRQGLDAVIVQDMGAFSLIRREFPQMDIHTSTQMTVTGRYGAEYMKKLGASRIVTAREMSFAEIKEIHENVDIEIESFVHGALCYCYSGQCLLSSMLGGRSGNRGRCAQPCRLPYEAYDSGMKKISGRGDFVLSLKDLNTIEYIPQLVESGIYSFKIEGRMKQAEYAAGVVSVYREYIDRYFADKENYRVSKEDNKKLMELGNRSGFTNGYYTRWNGGDMITFGKPNHSKANEALQSEIREKYIGGEIKEKINGILRLKKDFPATIELSYEDICIEQKGEAVQAALKQPLSLEKVEASMKKTGGTPFEFEHLTIDMEDGVFMPVQALNQLRRDALMTLLNVVTRAWHREEERQQGTGQVSHAETVREENSRDMTEQPENLAVSIELREQLPEILCWTEVNDIYLDSSCYTRKNVFLALKEDAAQIHEKQKKAYYILPAVFRSRTAKFYEEQLDELLGTGIDGVLVKSFDAAVFAGEKLQGRLAVILDHSLYSWNREAKERFRDFSPLRDTAPLELNRKELFGRDNRGSEILIYGRLPLMTSAQCIHSNLRLSDSNRSTGGCDKHPTVTYLKDRYGKYFPVKNNCMECYNTLYNTMPLVLFGFHDDFRKMGMAGYRISFTIEDEKEVREIMKRYCDIFVTGRKKTADVFANTAYTNGHYKRGAE